MVARFVGMRINPNVILCSTPFLFLQLIHLFFLGEESWKLLFLPYLHPLLPRGAWPLRYPCSRNWHVLMPLRVTLPQPTLHLAYSYLHVRAQIKSHLFQEAFLDPPDCRNFLDFKGRGTHHTLYVVTVLWSVRSLEREQKPFFWALLAGWSCLPWTSVFSSVGEDSYAVSPTYQQGCCEDHMRQYGKDSWYGIKVDKY